MDFFNVHDIADAVWGIMSIILMLWLCCCQFGL